MSVFFFPKGQKLEPQEVQDTFECDIVSTAKSDHSYKIKTVSVNKSLNFLSLEVL